MVSDELQDEGPCLYSLESHSLAAGIRCRQLPLTAFDLRFCDKSADKCTTPCLKVAYITHKSCMCAQGVITAQCRQCHLAVMCAICCAALACMTSADVGSSG
jgi:hypothetical protein